MKDHTYDRGITLAKLAHVYLSWVRAIYLWLIDWFIRSLLGVDSTIPGAKAAVPDTPTITTKETFTPAYRCTVAITHTWSLKLVTLRFTPSSLCCLHRNICMHVRTFSSQIHSLIRLTTYHTTQDTMSICMRFIS